MSGPLSCNTSLISPHELISSHSVFTPQFNTILMTLVCFVCNPFNNAKVLARIFIDHGSEIQLIKSETSQKLGLVGTKVTLVVGVSGGRIERKPNQNAVTYCLESLNGKFRTGPILGATIPTVANRLRSIDVDPKKHDHLKNIRSL